MTTARLGVAVAVAGFVSFVCLVVFFAVGGPFGAINDVGNAVTGLLAGALAVRLRRGLGPTVVAVVGAAVTVVGTVLVMSNATGFFLAGLVSGLGFALIGIWLIVANARSVVPARLRTLGVIAGAVMALGLVDIVGIAAGTDDMDSAGWVQYGGVNWLGTYVLMPIWSLWLARTLTVGSPGGTELLDRRG